MIDLRRLRHLLALAEHRNFSRAAEAVHLSQPALSRSIQALEQSIGAALFDRHHGGIELTEMGRLLLRHASALDAEFRDLDREIGLAKGLELGELHIAAGPWGGAAVVGAAIGRLNKLYPKLRVRLVIGPWKELPERARTRDVDLIVGGLQDMSALDDFEQLQLSPHPTVVICRAGHPLTTLRRARLADLPAYPWVGPRLGPEPQRLLQRLAHPREIDPLLSATPLTIECDSSSVLKDMLADSDALAAMPRFMVEAELRDGRLAVVPKLDLGLRVRFGVAWLRGRSVTGAGAKFIELLQAHDAALAARDAAARASPRSGRPT